MIDCWVQKQKHRNSCYAQRDIWIVTHSLDFCWAVESDLYACMTVKLKMCILLKDVWQCDSIMFWFEQIVNEENEEEFSSKRE